MKTFSWLRVLVPSFWNILSTFIVFIAITALCFLEYGFLGYFSLLAVPSFFAHLIGFNFTPPSFFVINDSLNQYPIPSLLFAITVYLFLLYIPVSIFVYLLRKLKLRRIYVFVTYLILLLMIAGGLYVIKVIPILSPSQIIFSKPTMTIYLNTEATEMQAQSLISAIKQVNGVYKVTYISQQDAYNIYKQDNKNSPLLISLTKPSELSASINVYLAFSSAGDKVINLTTNQSFVANVADFRK